MALKNVGDMGTFGDMGTKKGFVQTNDEFFRKNMAWEIHFSVYLLQIKKNYTSNLLILVYLVVQSPFSKLIRKKYSVFKSIFDLVFDYHMFEVQVPQNFDNFTI